MYGYATHSDQIFFVNDRIKSEEINIKWISTNEMISDILTKPPKGAEFKELRGLLLNL